MPLTTRQDTILTWLGRAYPQAAKLFASVLIVAADSRIPCRIRLMAHTYREMCIVIMNRHSSNSRVEMAPLLDEMASEYRKLNYKPSPLLQSDADATPTPDPAPVSVPESFMRCSAKVVESHGSRSKAKDRMRAAFEAMSADSAGIKSDVAPTADRWYEMYNYFVGRTHDPNADDGGTDPTQLEREVQFFEETLISLAQPAIPNLDALDAILANANA